jgi:hypothetical protein
MRGPRAGRGDRPDMNPPLICGLAVAARVRTTIYPMPYAAQVKGRIKRRLGAGDCCGFPAGTGLAHQLVNRSDAPVLYLEIGDRTPDETVEYPHAFGQ